VSVMIRYPGGDRGVDLYADSEFWTLFSLKNGDQLICRLFYMWKYTAMFTNDAILTS